MKPKDIWNATKKAVKKRSPEIFIGLGIGGMVTSVVLAIKATPKACRLIEEKKSAEGKSELTKKEVIKTTWKCYIPTASTCLVSAGLIITANAIHNHRNAALAAAYSVSETALKNYKSKVIETLGEKKEKTIRDKVHEEEVNKNPYDGSEVPCSKGGETLCFDTFTGRYFRNDIETLRKAANDLNFKMRNAMYISLNDFYYDIGLEPIKYGNDLGWNINKEGYIDLDFTSMLVNGTPCLVVDFVVGPRFEYDRFI